MAAGVATSYSTYGARATRCVACARGLDRQDIGRHAEHREHELQHAGTKKLDWPVLKRQLLKHRSVVCSVRLDVARLGDRPGVLSAWIVTHLAGTEPFGADSDEVFI